ncbi:MAG TPA: alpha/beta hydrolase-fold protein [Bacteroidota bacterium]|nr:alpha/beta hydrolase-fold protein [Bacteroidota bacterium]
MKKFILILMLSTLGNTVHAQNQFQSFLSKVDSLATNEAKMAAVDSFMTYAATKGFPFIEGDTATFLYRGSSSSVYLSGDMDGWPLPGEAMRNLAGTDLFYYTHLYEPTARLDYKFQLNGATWILDPLNLHQVAGGFGPNSELAMPQFVQPWEIAYKPSILHGATAPLRLFSTNMNANYNITVYLPPGYDTNKTYPVAYFQDGGDYINLGSAINILDNLLDSNLIHPVIGVFVTPNNRNVEYAGSARDQYVAFFAEELVPYIDSHYQTIAQAASRAVIGDSYGGNISALISYYHPELFGKCGLHSGAFQPYNYEAYNLFLNSPPLNVQFAAVWGTYEPLPQVMHPFRDSLHDKGYRFEWLELPEGHSWGLWRHTTAFILENFFPASVDGVAPIARGTPRGFRLDQNYPNPFNPTTTIRYEIPKSAHVVLTIENVLGQEVTRLVDQVEEPGEKTVQFKATNFPSGVYLCRIFAGAFTDARKMVLVK